MRGRKMKINLEGKRFGRWIVNKKSPLKKREIFWTCTCECGTVRDVRGNDLKNGDSTSCGCKRDEKRGQNRLRPYESIYNLILKNPDKHKVDLTYEQFVKFTEINECSYCKSSVNWSAYDYKKNGSAYNLDRKDSNLGYSIENCVVSCKRCNRAKNNHFTYEEWVKIGELIQSWNLSSKG